MLWRLILSTVFAVAVHAGKRSSRRLWQSDKENAQENQLLPEDTLVHVARYLESGGKAAMERTSRSCAISVSKSSEHGIESLEIYRKYKDLIDNTNLTAEQIFKSFTWNPLMVGNGRAEQFHNPHQVLSAGDVENEGFHESYLSVKVVRERFAFGGLPLLREFTVSFFFRNGQLDRTLFRCRFPNWVDVHRNAGKDYLHCTQIQLLIQKESVYFENVNGKRIGPVIRSDTSVVRQALLLIRWFLPVIMRLMAAAIMYFSWSYYTPDPDTNVMVAIIIFVCLYVMMINNER